MPEQGAGRISRPPQLRRLVGCLPRLCAPALMLLRSAPRGEAPRTVGYTRSRLHPHAVTAMLPFLAERCATREWVAGRALSLLQGEPPPRGCGHTQPPFPSYLPSWAGQTSDANRLSPEQYSSASGEGCATTTPRVKAAPRLRSAACAMRKLACHHGQKGESLLRVGMGFGFRVSGPDFAKRHNLHTMRNQDVLSTRPKNSPGAR